MIYPNVHFSVLSPFLLLSFDLSLGQTIATCQRNMSQHCWVQHVACVWPPCCDLLSVVGSNLTIFKLEPTTPNISQHIATRWPNACNMLHLRYIALACYDRLAGALSLSCKLQRVDLITVFAACLAVRQTILVCFFFPEKAGKEKRQMCGKLKTQLGAFQYRYTPNILSVKSFSQNPRSQLKNVFLHLFHIGWPCKHYNFQTCLRDN